MKNNIFNSFIFCSIAAILLVVAAYYSEKINNEYSIVKLDYFQKDTLKSIRTINIAKADTLTEKLLKEDTVIVKKISKKATVDTLYSLKNSDTITRDNLIKNFVFQDSSKALDNFFSALIHQSDTCIVRIAHYGDSQLEGDRVTSHLRKNLQAKFGGEGPGFLPLADNTNSATYSRTTNKISRYNVFSRRIKNGIYGLSGNIYKTLLAIKNDSSINKDKPAFVSFKMNDFRKAKSLKIITTKSDTLIKLKIISNNRDTSITKIISQQIKQNINTIPIDILPYSQKFEIQFLENNAMILGVNLDGENGIAVDNFAIRGHSGDGLLKMDTEYLSKQIKLSNTKLVIFQYGNNMVPYLESVKECLFFQKSFERLFRKFKKDNPGISILVIGNGDMGRIKEGTSQSYPIAYNLDEVLKNAAKNTGCAYWSMYHAMGGYGAIISWTNKGMASIDGHLTPKGQRVISNMIFKALMLEYNDYIERNED